MKGFGRAQSKSSGLERCRHNRMANRCIDCEKDKWRKAMRKYLLKKGTVVKYKGIPVALTEDVVVETKTDLSLIDTPPPTEAEGSKGKDVKF